MKTKKYFKHWFINKFVIMTGLILHVVYQWNTVILCNLSTSCISTCRDLKVHWNTLDDLLAFRIYMYNTLCILYFVMLFPINRVWNIRYQKARNQRHCCPAEELVWDSDASSRTIQDIAFKFWIVFIKSLCTCALSILVLCQNRSIVKYMHKCSFQADLFYQ